ncbi:MAG: PQQ-binding-like beta-propeller repeat protein [Planctomycetes bacterium]|nr:PQQ-binding-like beta-propeller repeat protein [Planctomycetota bacterium]
MGLLLALALQAAFSSAELLGNWSGEAVHAGASTPYALEITSGSDGKLAIAIDLPAIHVLHQPLGEFAPNFDGDDVELEWLGKLRHNPRARTLSGVVPETFAPVYELAFTLRRVDAMEFPERKELGAPLAKPLWTFETGSAAWPGPTCAGERVLVGSDDGVLRALDAESGAKLWQLATGGRLRSRATLVDDSALIHSDDGLVYRVDLASGAELWRARVERAPIVRLPFDDPKSRYDRFGSEVTSYGGKLYVGAHDGRVVALDPNDGRELWSFDGAQGVLAAPAVDGERVVFGGWDGCVRALDAKSGKELWKFDTQEPVVSTPALVGDRAIVGSRSYDLFGLDIATGAVAWQRYLWFSWIESSPSVRDGDVYVGSSDAAVLAAYEARTGNARWITDVHGWAWGQPAVGAQRVYVGTSGQGGYLAPHHGGLVAVERSTGRPIWRFASASSSDGAHGFPGSPALCGGRVFASSLDGSVFAFAE